jgi:vitamin B12 transporter
MVLSALLLLAASMPAWAQTDEEIEVISQAETQPVDASSVVTVVEIDERLGASAELADALGGVPGTVVRRLGGLGHWSSVSLRGSSARQVEVLIDGVPLNPDGGSAVDLSELPLRAFERVEVYRGGAPELLGGSAVGGSVQLLTGEDVVRSVQVTAGGHAAVRASGLLSAPVGPAGLWLATDLLTNRGDFTAYDDGGTPYSLLDDRVAPRLNNDVHQGAGVARVRVPLGGAKLTLLKVFTAREQGVPGFLWAPSLQVRHHVLRDTLSARVDGALNSTTVSGLLWGGMGLERLEDPVGELGGLVRNASTRLPSVGSRLSARTAWSEHWVSTLSAGLRGQGVVRADPAGGDLAAGRQAWDGMAGVTLHLGSWMLGPSCALYGSSISQDGTRRGALEALPRVGTRLDLGDAMALKANLGRYVRPPDATELFGDSGALVGNPDLSGEVGINADVALVGEVADRFTAEAAWFWVDARDRIAWVQNAQRIARPENLGRALILGAEASASMVWVPAFRTASTLTWTSASNRSQLGAYAGKQLPGVPEWEGSHTTSVGAGRVVVGHTLAATSGSWYDAANWLRAAPRWNQGARVRLVPGRGYWFELEVRNLTDPIAQQVPRNPLDDDGTRAPLAVTDFLGYPLPGRTVWASMGWRG